MLRHILSILALAATGLILRAQVSPPELVFPPPGDVLSQGNLTLTWNPVQGAVSYAVQVAEDSLFLTTTISQQGLTATSLPVSLAIGKTYYWRAYSFNGSVSSAWSPKQRFTVFHPQMLPGLALWLDPDSAQLYGNSQRVQKLYDLSGHGRHALQNDTSKMPVKLPDTLGGNSLIDFDGLTQEMEIDSPIYYAALGTFAQWTDNVSVFPNTNGLISRSTGAIPSYLVCGRANTTQLTSNSQSLLQTSVRINGTTTYIYAPMTQPKIISGTRTDSAYVHESLLGSYKSLAGRYWKGYMGELMVYSTPLGQAQLQLLEQYFFNKYGGGPVSLGRDILVSYSLCDPVLDAGPGYVSYQWSNGDTTRQTTADADGSYWVTATDIFGFEWSDTVDVSFQLPDPDIMDTVICLGTQAQVTSAYPGNLYSFLWSDNQTDTVLSTSSAGTYWLSVSDSLGCTLTDTFTVEVDSFKVTASLGPDRSLCAGNLISLVSSASQAVAYQWASGSTLAWDTVTVSGPYSLTVTDHLGCVATDTVDIYVKGVAPTVAFQADSVCFGQPTTFLDISSTQPPDSVASWTWDFGDGLGSGPSLTHQFLAAGIHPVSLEVGTDSGCVASITRDVLVYPAPTADFSPGEGCQRDSIAFLDLSIAPFSQVSDWTWVFHHLGTGMPDTSHLQDPVHVFQSYGTDSVSLLIESDAGCLAQVSRSFNVKPSPLAAFTASDGCVGQVIQFTDNSTSIPANPIVSRLWDFGDNSSSAQANPQHGYQAAGDYGVSLLAQGFNGCSSTHRDSLRIGMTPLAGFIVPSPCVNTPEQLVNITFLPSGTVSLWRWSLNGVPFSTLEEPMLMIADTGSYLLELYAETSLGCSDSRQEWIIVSPRPRAAFSPDFEYGTPPHTVSFQNQSLGASDFEWDFGDGSTSNLLSPVHTFIDSGVYQVRLIVNNLNGCSDTTYRMVYVLSSSVDLVTDQVITVIDGDRLSFSARVSNAGTRIIRETLMTARLPNGYSLAEISYDTLSPGESSRYQFKSFFIISEDATPSFLCINAEAQVEQEDVHPFDNEDCLALAGEFRVTEAYPNPAGDHLFLDVLLPEAGQVLIEVIRTDGRIMSIPLDEELDEGLHFIDLSLEGIPDGVMLLRVAYKDQVSTQRIVKYKGP